MGVAVTLTALSRSMPVGLGSGILAPFEFIHLVGQGLSYEVAREDGELHQLTRSRGYLLGGRGRGHRAASQHRTGPPGKAQPRRRGLADSKIDGNRHYELGLLFLLHFWARHKAKSAAAPSPYQSTI